MGITLVTGGSGFLGRRLVHKLVETGHKQIRCIVRPGTPSNFLRSVLVDVSLSDVDVFPASFNDNDALKSAFKGVDIIYHVAASKKGSFPSMVANTVLGSENIYKASINAGVSRFVLVSSLGVLGTAPIPRKVVIDENIAMDKHPEWRDPYTFSKHRQETLAWKYAKDMGLPLVVVRPGVIIGPDSEILCTRIGLKLFGLFLHLGGTNQIPLTYVDNCAEAIIRAGTVPNIEGEAFCIVDDDLPKSRHLLRRYCREVVPLRIVRIPYRVLRIIARCNVWYTDRTNGHLPSVFTPYEVEAMWKGHRLSNRKAKDVLGWTPKVSMKDSLDITYRSLAKFYVERE